MCPTGKKEKKRKMKLQDFEMMVRILILSTCLGHVCYGCQVILISSSEEPVPKALVEKIAQRSGCSFRHGVERKQPEVECLIKARGLQWKDVAYLGEARRSLYTQQINITKR